MDYARPLQLDTTGRPLLSKDELTIKIQEHIDLYNNDTKAHHHGISIVTSHRLCWIGGTGPADVALHWHLSHVHSASKEEGGIFAGSAKIVLRFRQVGQEAPAPGHAKLSFKTGGRDEFFDQLNNALRRKEWAAPLAGAIPIGSRAASDGAAASPAVRYVPGLAGIQDRARDERAKAAADVSDAMSDLRSLSEHAKGLVQLAEEYAAKAAARAAAPLPPRSVSEGAGSDGAPPSPAPDDSGYANSVSQLVRDLGIVNPVTRAAAGTLYLQEVARQLASFLRAPLERVGGVLSLADVYSLYNRARVTDLISPDDLVEAARLLEPLHLGMHLHTFPSRLVVVRLDSFSPQGVALRLQALLAARSSSSAGKPGSAEPYVSALDVAAEWKTPLQIATQLLLVRIEATVYSSSFAFATPTSSCRPPPPSPKQTAESQGAVCRDDSIAGLRFYANRFVAAS
jgi:ESCRT-II complex subunit VPS36